MNDEPKNNWKRPLTGWRKQLAWFAIFVAVFFVTVCICALASDNKSSVGETILASLLIAVIVSAVALLVIRFIRWLCCWRNFKRFLFGFVCFVTLIALLYAEEDWRGWRAWSKHRRAWEAKGEKFTIAALVPPPVPDEKNFALTPLLKPPLDFTRVNGKVVWRDTNGWSYLQKIHADLPSHRKTNDNLVLGSLEKGTLADLEACRNFYRGNTNYPQPVQSGTAAEDILVALGKFDPEMKELREAAATRPYSRFPVKYDEQPSWGILLPHLAHVKALCMLAEARAIARLGLGQSAEALEELKVGFRLSDSIHDEPLLIDHLVRIATLMLDLRVVQEGLARHAWSDVQLVELETHLASINLLAEYKFAMRGERALSTEGLDWLRRQGFRTDIGNYFAGENGASGFPIHFNTMPSGWLYQNMLTVSQMHQDFVIPAVDENAHRIFVEFSERLADASVALAKQRYHPYKCYAALLFPALDKAIIRSARSQTYVDAARVACALERYRLANGKLPDTLDALAPRFIEKIPSDVIDGKLLRYRLASDGGYVIYSIGWNKTDDGGVLGWTTDKPPRVDTQKGDWIWRYPSN